MRKLFAAISKLLQALAAILAAFTMNEADIAAASFFFNQNEEEEE
jgi:hypothetical protein